MEVFNYSGSNHPSATIVRFLRWRGALELKDDTVIELAYMDEDESNEQKLTVIAAQNILANAVIRLNTPTLIDGV